MTTEIAGNKTTWNAVQYGNVGGEVCRISEWKAYMPNSSPKKFTLHPINGGSPHCGLLEGEFNRYNEQETDLIRTMLAQTAKPEDYEPVWRD